MVIKNTDIEHSFELLINSLIVNFLAVYELSKSDKYSKFGHFTFKGPFSEKSVKLPGNYEQVDKEISVSIYSAYAIAAYEILKSWEGFKAISSKTEIQLLKHIKNASLNNNRFILNKDLLPETLIWKKKKLTTRRNGKECFFAFLGVGNLFSLLEDVQKILKQNFIFSNTIKQR